MPSNLARILSTSCKQIFLVAFAIVDNFVFDVVVVVAAVACTIVVAV